MTFKALQKNRLLSGVGGIGLGLALVVIGYALVPSASSGLASSAVESSMRAQVSPPAEGLRERLRISGLQDTRSTSPASDQALDDSRECDANKGIGEHCLYN